MLASTSARCRSMSSASPPRAPQSLLRAPTRLLRSRPVAVAANKDGEGGGGGGGGGGPGALSPETRKRFDAMLAQLRSTGLDQSRARRLLKAWAKAGALEPEALKELLVRRALTPASSLGTQAAIDFVAAVVGFYAGASVGNAEPFSGQILVQVACYFGGMWYAISGFSGASALAQVLLAARRYASSADALLAAVQVLAGPEGVAAAAASEGGGVGVGRVAANVALAVNTAKVVAALDAIAGQLRAMDEGGGGAGADGAAAAGGGAASAGAGAAAAAAGRAQKSTLVSLAAFLTVQQAEEKAGFVPSDYGLTEKEANAIAAVFAMYDRNENFVLDPEELGLMCRELGRELSDAEVREAGRLLAAGGSGGGAGGGAVRAGARGVTFPAFVRWWTGRGPEAAAGDKGKEEKEAAAPAA